MGKGKDTEGAIVCCGVCWVTTVFCFFLIILLILCSYGVVKIVIGAVYLHDCDIEDNVPIFLIVSGVVSILFGGSAKQNNQASNDGRGRSNYGCVDICKGIIFLFSLAWLIAGSVWVYGTWSTMKSDPYVPCDPANSTPGCTTGSCNDVLLTFAFVTCTIDWVLFGAGVAYTCWKIYWLCSEI